MFNVYVEHILSAYIFHLCFTVYVIFGIHIEVFTRLSYNKCCFFVNNLHVGHVCDVILNIYVECIHWINTLYSTDTLVLYNMFTFSVYVGHVTLEGFMATVFLALAFDHFVHWPFLWGLFFAVNLPC